MGIETSPSIRSDGPARHPGNIRIGREHNEGSALIGATRVTLPPVRGHGGWLRSWRALGGVQPGGRASVAELADGWVTTRAVGQFPLTKRSAASSLASAAWLRTYAATTAA
jgi:hypothetical protein